MWVSGIWVFFVSTDQIRSIQWVVGSLISVFCNPFELVVQTLLHHFSDWYVDALFAEFYLGSVYASCPCDQLLNFWLWSMGIHPFKLSNDLAVVRL